MKANEKKKAVAALSIAFACGAYAFGGCKNDASGNGKSIAISGSSSVAPLMGVLANEYEKRNAGVKIEVATSDSGTGAKDVQDGLCDFGMTSRALKPSEKGVIEKTIAIDGVALIVHKNSAVEDVTPEEVYGLYANGTPIGGTITAGINREAGSGTRDAFDGLIKKDGNSLKKLTTFASVITEANGTDAVKTEVSKNFALIGYISTGSLDGTVKALRFKGAEATPANVKSGAYDLFRPFNAVYRSEDELSELAKAFLDFVMSEDGQKLVENEGYVSVL